MQIKSSCAVMFLSLFVTLAAFAGEQAEAPLPIGRRFEAIPWLADMPDLPQDVVNIADIPLLAGFVSKTEFYEVDPDVAVSGYSYFFYVRGKYRDYVVGSAPNLMRLCRELATIEEIRGMNKGKELALGAAEGVSAIGTGLSNLVLHPGQGFASFGRRIRVAGRSVERAFDSDAKVGMDERGIDRSHLGSGPAGAIRRRIAYELGIDVYTDNPDLRRELTELSQVKAVGNFATWAVPYYIGMFSYFNPLSGDEKAEQIIRDFDPAELRRQVGINLEPMFNMSREGGESDLSRLLLNPNYSPRQIAYIGVDMGYLAGVGGLGGVLSNLAAVDSPERADLMSIELRLYSFFHRRITPIARMEPYMNMFAAVDSAGGFNFLFAGDTVRPWDATADAVDLMIREAMAARATALTVWVLGDVDAGMVESARARNVTVRQNILRDPVFFPAPEQMERRD